MNDRRERIGRNEALFREVNERIEGIGVSFAGGRPSRRSQLELICECGDSECFETVEVTVEEYENVRSQSDLLLLRSGHEASDVEQVVSRNDRFSVVRKRPGRPTELAEETDPRRAEP